MAPGEQQKVERPRSTVVVDVAVAFGSPVTNIDVLVQHSRHMKMNA